MKAKSGAVTAKSGLAVRVAGIAGAVAVLGLVAVLAAAPFVRRAEMANEAAMPHRETLAGRLYDMTMAVQEDGSFEVRLVAVEPGPDPLIAVQVSMRSGAMRATPTVDRTVSGTFVIRGQLAMRGEWEMAIEAGGRQVVIPLSNTWSFSE